VQSGVTVMMIPCVILFLLLQRYYVRGLTAGAVK
jgi:multiple sugar transport system permease protein